MPSVIQHKQGRKPGGGTWTQPMIDDLERMYSKPYGPEYMTTGEITAALRETYGKTYKGNITRNGVISKATSMGFTVKYPRKAASAKALGDANRARHGKKKSTAAMPRPERHAISAARVIESKKPQRGGNAMAMTKALAPVCEDPFEPSANNVSYMEAEAHHCMWPVGMKGRETIVCGNKRWNNGSYKRPSQYCAHHSRAGSGGSQAMRSTKPDKSYRRPNPRFS